MFKNVHFFSKAKVVLVLGAGLLLPATSCNNLKEDVKPAAMLTDSKLASYKEVADAFSYAMGSSNLNSGARLSAVNSTPQSPAEFEARILQYLNYTRGYQYESQYRDYLGSPYMQNLNYILRSGNYAAGNDQLAAIVEAVQASNQAQTALQNFINRMLAHLEAYNEDESITQEQLVYNFSQEIEIFKQEVANSFDMPEGEKEALMVAISAQLAEGLSEFTTVSNEVSLANDVVNDEESGAAGGRLSAVQKTWFGKFIVKAGNFVVNVVVLSAAAILAQPGNPNYDPTIPLIAALVVSVYDLFQPWDQQRWWS